MYLNVLSSEVMVLLGKDIKYTHLSIGDDKLNVKVDLCNRLQSRGRIWLKSFRRMTPLKTSPASLFTRIRVVKREAGESLIYYNRCIPDSSLAQAILMEMRSYFQIEIKQRHNG